MYLLRTWTNSKYTPLWDRVKFSDKLLDESAYTEKYCEMIKRSAKMEAEKIRSEATADRNKVVAKAEGILRQKEEIIAAAERWAKSLQAKYDELSEKVMSLLKMERRLQGEVVELQDKRMELEPIKQEVEEMKKAKSILSGELSYEFTRSKFRSWRSNALDRAMILTEKKVNCWRYTKMEQYASGF